MTDQTPRSELKTHFNKLGQFWMSQTQNCHWPWVQIISFSCSFLGNIWPNRLATPPQKLSTLLRTLATPPPPVKSCYCKQKYFIQPKSLLTVFFKIGPICCQQNILFCLKCLHNSHSSDKYFWFAKPNKKYICLNKNNMTQWV